MWVGRTGKWSPRSVSSSRVGEEPAGIQQGPQVHYRGEDEEWFGGRGF